MDDYQRPSVLCVLYYLRHFPNGVVKQVLQVALCNSWYFPGMLRLSRKYVAECKSCQLRKAPPTQATMRVIHHTMPLLQTVTADLMDLRAQHKDLGMYCLS